MRVPDLPGCFSAGYTLDEALANAAEAIAFHIEGLLDAGEKIPPPQTIESHTTNPDDAVMIWAITQYASWHLFTEPTTLLVGVAPSQTLRPPFLLVFRMTAC